MNDALAGPPGPLPRSAAGVPFAGPPGGAVDGRDSRWQTHRARRRRELIKAARQAVHALGSDASMEEIAAAAGTSKSVFYRYFGDKAGLQQAVGEVVLGQMQRRIQEAAQAAPTPREGLLAMVSAYLQMAETSPDVYIFVTRTSPGDPDGAPAFAASPGTAGALGHFFAAVSEMLARPMRSHLGSGPGKDAVIGYWPHAAIGLVRNAGEQWLASPATADKPDQGAMARQITDWLCFGIAGALAKPPGPGSAGGGPDGAGLRDVRSVVPQADDPAPGAAASTPEPLPEAPQEQT